MAVTRVLQRTDNPTLFSGGLRILLGFSTRGKYRTIVLQMGG